MKLILKNIVAMTLLVPSVNFASSQAGSYQESIEEINRLLMVAESNKLRNSTLLEELNTVIKKYCPNDEESIFYFQELKIHTENLENKYISKEEFDARTIKSTEELGQKIRERGDSKKTYCFLIKR
jgi:hypothetical protein